MYVESSKQRPHADRFRGTISAVGWASVCRTGNYNAPHNHPDSAWSGVYYVDSGDPDDTMPLGSCLEILDPRSAAGGVNTPGDPFGHPVRIPPRAGQLTVFPSWLTHWVHPHSGRGDRIAISSTWPPRQKIATASPSDLCHQKYISICKSKFQPPAGVVVYGSSPLTGPLGTDRDPRG